jgi:hypothetical protein
MRRAGYLPHTFDFRLYTANLFRFDLSARLFLTVAGMALTSLLARGLVYLFMVSWAVAAIDGFRRELSGVRGVGQV